MYQSRRRRVVFIVLILLSIAILTRHFRESPESFLHQSQRLALTVVSPFQSAANFVVSPFSNLWGYVSHIGAMGRENRSLKSETIRLRQEATEVWLLRKENDRLRALLAYKKKVPYKLVPADVVSRPTGTWQDVMVINVGSSDRVSVNMPVVIGEGLVGQVVRTTPRASLVQLIIDRRSGVAAMLTKAGETGIVEGQIGGKLGLSFVSKNTRVAVGDPVVTSGLGGVFPKGILIGEIKSVVQRPYDLFQSIEVDSHVDFTKLDQVFVIVNPPPKPPFGN